MTLFESAEPAQGALFEPEVFRLIRRLPLSTREKGTRFELVMQAALHEHPELGFDEVWMWMDWPDRLAYGFRDDPGVDLVARHPKTGLWAIQCKFYADGTVPSDRIARFLSTGLSPPFDATMLVNTGRTTRNSFADLSRAGTKLVDLAELETWPVDWATGLESPETVSWNAPIKQPLPHQQEALDAIAKGFETHQRGTVVMPCGTGKSLVAMWAAESAVGRGGSVLYAVPSIALMGQTMREWAANRTIPHDYIGVCSDPSTGRTHRDDAPWLAQVPMPVTTDRDAITRRLAEPLDAGEMRVVLTTYQSLPVLADAIEAAEAAVAGDIRADGTAVLGATPFDLFICDEAHRTTGIERAEASGSATSASAKRASGFHLAHDDDAIPALRRLYMTATPRVFTARARKQADRLAERLGRELDSYSMDDPETYGLRFHELRFSEAIDRDLLCDYRVLVVGKKANDRDLGDKYIEVLREADSGGRSNARGGLVAEHYATKLLGVLDALAAPKTVAADPDRVSGEVADRTGAPLRTAILFPNTVARSKTVGDAGHHHELLGSEHSLLSAISDDLRALYRDDGRSILAVETQHMDGTTRADVRARQLGWLRDDRSGSRLPPSGDGVERETPTCRVLSNAKVLSEGVDVPALDAVVFMDPRKSTIDITQAVGRAIRKAPGKELGYIVIPVVVPEGSEMNSQEVLAGSDFGVVWDVVRALRSHDDRVDHWLNGVSTSPPIDIIGPVIDNRSSEADDDTSNGSDDEADASVVEQLDLFESIKRELERQVFSKMVDICGDRQMWPTWGANAAAVCELVRQRVDALLADSDARDAFSTFVESIRETAGAHTTEAECVEMVTQHVVTIPIFDALFPNSGFAKENPMSRAMDRLLADVAGRSEANGGANRPGTDGAEDVSGGGITAGATDTEAAPPGTDGTATLVGYALANRLFAAELKPLTRAYRTMRQMLSEDITPAAKVDLMREIYDGFFAHAMEAATKRLGIVYTPVEIVDFMVRATDALCRRHFGKGLTAESVHILEPFCGTGTFLYRLLTAHGADRQPIIRQADLARKYRHELHANELVLLAYYVAALKIEAGMEERDGFDTDESGQALFTQFENIVHCDTFLSTGPFAEDTLEGTTDNSAAAQLQNELPIKVIITNPPWSAGQKQADDDNPNIAYPEVEQRVRDTYGKRHREVTDKGAGKAMGNLYVEAIRWASDRVGDPKPSRLEGGRRPAGIVALVHPNSLSTGTSLAGMRAALRDEWSDIYVVNLRGDAMKSGNEFRREGDKIFGAGSRNGVQITLLVSDPTAPDGPGRLHYAEVPEYSSVAQKFDWLAGLAPDLADVGDGFTEVPVNGNHDWVNVTDGAFEQLPIVLCALSKSKQHAGAEPGTAVAKSVLGLTTNCDIYVYSFSRVDLIDRAQRLIDRYEHVRIAMHQEGLSFESAVGADDAREIKWTDRLIQAAKRNIPIEFEDRRIREVLYRPFTKLWLYEDDRILSSVKSISALFPREDNDTSQPARDRRSDGPSSSIRPSNSPSESSPATPSSTSASQGARPAQSREGRHHDQQPSEQDPIRGVRDQELAGSEQPRRGRAGGPTDAMTPFTLLGGLGVAASGLVA
ncbi:MAG: DEAD/DEAH box helicase family protein, partial [Acidimicrobiaceae bacterium]|nr:DEAD/DEAH box helicase family protein [Acidimicrobiaceae bacterium]